MEDNSIYVKIKHKLIITVVKKGLATKIINATKAVGAEGGTIFLGEGSARENIYLDILGISFEPEKEIILSYVKAEIADKVLDTIREFANLDKVGTGISMIVDIKSITGIYHLMNNMEEV